MNFNEMRKESAPQKEQDNNLNPNLELIQSQSEKIEQLTQELLTKQSKIDELGQSILKLNEENENLLKLSKNEKKLQSSNESLENTNKKLKQENTVLMGSIDRLKKTLEKANNELTLYRTNPSKDIEESIRKELNFEYNNKLSAIMENDSKLGDEHRRRMEDLNRRESGIDEKIKQERIKALGICYVIAMIGVACTILSIRWHAPFFEDTMNFFKWWLNALVFLLEAIVSWTQDVCGSPIWYITLLGYLLSAAVIFGIPMLIGILWCTYARPNIIEYINARADFSKAVLASTILLLLFVYFGDLVKIGFMAHWNTFGLLLTISALAFGYCDLFTRKR